MYDNFFLQYLVAVVNTVNIETILLNCFREWNLGPSTFQDSVLTIKRNIPANFVYQLIVFIYTSHVWYFRKNNGLEVIDCKYFRKKKSPIILFDYIFN